MADREKLDVHGRLMGLLQRTPYISCADTDRQYAVNWLMNNGVTVRERGRWHLEAHEEHLNYRWNVTAECPYCHSEKKEIWAGFLSGFSKDLAELVCLENAKFVKLSNFCPNCGADMREKKGKVL